MLTNMPSNYTKKKIKWVFRSLVDVSVIGVCYVPMKSMHWSLST